MARDGRRRRVLHEEIKSSLGLAAVTAGSDAADAPRYGEQANIEHHPQITDFIPRRIRGLAVVFGGGIATAAVAQSLSFFAEPLAKLAPGIESSAFADLAHGVTAWTSAVLLLLIATVARITFSLRRHRVDDFRGRYRVWRRVVWGAMLASFLSVVGGQELISRAARSLTGWSLTAAGAEWWIVPMVAIAAWIGFRLAFELAESRSTSMMALAAVGCYTVALASELGWRPSLLGPATVIVGAAGLMGHTLALAALAWYARYVVLDVQGLIEHAPRPSVAAERSGSTGRGAGKLAQEPQMPAATSAAATSMARTVTPPAPSLDPAEDDEEEQSETGQYLSKAERKRLRKQQRRAA